MSKGVRNILKVAQGSGTVPALAQRRHHGLVVAQIVAQNAEAIERGVLALNVKLGDAPEGAYVRDWSINGVDATLSVLKA